MNDVFECFNSFPPEIHVLILRTCEPVDAICLRLTCKYFYNLLSLPTPISLKSSSVSGLCDASHLNQKDNNYWERWQHRQVCHQESWKAFCKKQHLNSLPEPALSRCRTHRWNWHCECFERPSRLHHRLRSWMPKGLNYCGECDKFTIRKRNHNGRCYHGRGKPPKRQETFWTHRSRNGAFGRKLWKKWVNNAAMNSLEARLRSDRERRTGNRYELRTLPPKPVDTRIERGSYDEDWNVYRWWDRVNRS